MRPFFRLRTIAGALLYDAIPFETHLRGQWGLIRNRKEQITIDATGRGVRCEWKWTSTVHYCDVFSNAAQRLMRRALGAFPIVRRDAPLAGDPAISFVIGHRGAERLPLLLDTVRSIGGQDIPVECIVVEQAATLTARDALPPWVRHIHTPIGNDDAPYSRAAAFNEGVRHALAPVLVLHDNDMLVPAAYAREIVDHVNQGFEAVDLKRFIFYVSADGLHCESVVQNARGGSVAVTRRAYESIGGFDEAFVGWGGEDNDFWERAETLRTTRFGYLPFVHLWHAAQTDKGRSEATRRYHEIVAGISPEKRIARLRSR